MTGAPDVDVAGLNQLARELAQGGQLDHAEQILRVLAGAGLAEGESLKAYALALATHGQPLQAETWVRQAIAIDDADPISCNLLSYCLIQAERYDEAAEAARRAVALAPRFGDAHNNLGVALNRLGRNREALEASQAAVRLEPDCANLLNHANVLRDLGRAHDALAVTERACALGPQVAQAHYNRANLLQDAGRHAEAIPAYDTALALDPGHVSAHWNRALCSLLLGDFEAGWAGYEWRWREPATQLVERPYPYPLWLGESDPAGRSILVHCEQGLGDALQFIRYAPVLAELGARVQVEAFAPLQALFQTMPGLEAVLRPGMPAPAVDFHCPLMSLPLALRRWRPDIPAATPYLFPTPDQRQPWRERLAGFNGRRIGLTWCGSPTFRNDHNRSIPLAQFLHALPAGPDYFVLQTQKRDGDDALLQARPDITDLGPEIRDFTDTAAICQAMDLVISVDTSLAHLAGALGRPLMVLLPYHPDWRWGLNSRTTAWYPSAELWRQTAVGDWGTVLAELRARIQGVIAD